MSTPSSEANRIDVEEGIEVLCHQRLRIAVAKHDHNVKRQHLRYTHGASRKHDMHGEKPRVEGTIIQRNEIRSMS